MANKKVVKNAETKELTPREKRMAKAGIALVKEEVSDREAFRQFFVSIKKKLNLGSNMEEIIWLHFKAMGFDKAGKFEDGIKNFGYKI